MADAQFAEIWSDAIKRYEADTGKKKITTASDALKGVVSADSLLDLMDSEQREFKQYRSKGDRIRSVVKPILVVVERFAAVAGEGVGAVFEPGKAVFVAVKLLLNAARDVSEHYDMIIAIFERMQSSLERICGYLEGPDTVSSVLKNTLVKILAHLLSFLGLVTKDIQAGRIRHYILNLITKKNKIHDALERFDTLMEEEGLAVQEEIYLVTHQTHRVMEQAYRVVEQTYRAIEQAHVDEELQKCYDWLSPPDPSINYNLAQEKKGNMKTTGQWILHDSRFTAWMQGSHSSLWIYGIPGSGKSVLCSTIIKNLLETCKSETSAVVYFYFDFNDPSKQNFRNMLGSLLMQLASQNLGARSMLKQLWKTHNSGHEQPGLDSLQNVLGDVLVQLDAAYIVLDALDECLEDQRHYSLFLLVETMMLDSQYSVHFLCTSRAKVDIKDFLETKMAHTLALDTSLVHDDIAQYLSSVLSKDIFLSNVSEALKAQIQETLLKNADGMFLWVTCQLTVLKKCKMTKQIEKALHNLPKTLDATYERILNNAAVEDAAHLHYIFQWLAYAECPIPKKELELA
ncbi:hypothetical protein EVG20_g10704, partial [Dentipellis fragilis]